MEKSTACPRCHLTFSLEEHGHAIRYCSVRCRRHVNNRKYRARHREQQRMYYREYRRRRREERTPLPCVETACLPGEVP